MTPFLTPFGLDLSGSTQGAGGAGGLLALNDSVQGVHFASFDGDGNVAALVSANDAATSADYEYDPFGEVIRATGPMANANPFRFSTKYQDETRLVYYGYRYYNASTGRWSSRDPIGEAGGLDIYCMLRNAPIAAVDAQGLDGFGCCGCSPAKVLGAVIFSDRVNIGDKTSVVFKEIGSGKEFIEKVEKTFPQNKEIEKVCKDIKDSVEQITKAANYAEKAMVGLMQIYATPGYPFQVRLRAKYVCCAKNKLPDPHIREMTQWVASDEEDPAVYTVNSMNGLLGNLAKDWNAAMKQILQNMKSDCASGNPPSPSQE